MRLGEHDTSTLDDGPHEDIKIERIDKHFDYSEKFGTNDIAILHLVRDVELTSNTKAIYMSQIPVKHTFKNIFCQFFLYLDHIRPICLPINKELLNRNFVDENAFIAGRNLKFLVTLT